MSKTYQIKEYGSFVCSKNIPGYVSLPAGTFSALEDFILTNQGSETEPVEIMGISARKGIGKIITAKNYVGTIKMKDGTIIEILPKIYSEIEDDEQGQRAKRLVVDMLKTLRNSPFKTLQISNVDTAKMNIFEIFIKMFIDEVFFIVKRGLKCSYESVEENAAIYKGKMKFSQQLKFNYVHKERNYIEYDVFNMNRPENKLIKATLRYLYQYSASLRNKNDIKTLLTYFSDVATSVDYKADFAKYIPDRNMKDYDTALLWSRIFLMGKNFTSFSGSEVAVALLFPMEVLFESYIAALVRQELECVNDIKHKIEDIILTGIVDCDTGYEIFGLKEQSSIRSVVTPIDRIRNESIKIQKVIDANDSSLRSYYRNIFDLLTQLEECARMLETRKLSVSRGISRLISFEEKTIVDKVKDIDKIDDREKHEAKYKNGLNAIRRAEEKIADLRESQEIVDIDDAYFEKLKGIAKEIRYLLELFVMVKSERMEMSCEDQYQMIAQKDLLCQKCDELLNIIKNEEDPYWEYTNSILSECTKAVSCLYTLRNNCSVYLSYEYLKLLLDAKTYFSDAAENAVHRIYLSLMKRFGQEVDDKGRLDALECSPYLYLQILYLFTGIPDGVKESLITIDEAQNMTPEEMKLIKAVNGNNVVFNLFGDVKQHVEGSKGIDDWKRFADIADFQKEYMQENYRNARQITAYCNKRFKLSMRAINLDGTGVHECRNKNEFENSFTAIFQKPQNVGLSCILVKYRAEARSLLAKAGNYQIRINDMTGELVELQRNKWNMMTAEQAKGLEFETVFAVSGRMTENEKYIAYTRALDELYVYDEEIDLLLFSYTLPTIWACSGLTPVRARPWRANTKKRQLFQATANPFIYFSDQFTFFLS